MIFSRRLKDDSDDDDDDVIIPGGFIFSVYHALSCPVNHSIGRMLGSKKPEDHYEVTSGLQDVQVLLRGVISDLGSAGTAGGGGLGCSTSQGLSCIDVLCLTDVCDTFSPPLQLSRTTATIPACKGNGGMRMASLLPRFLTAGYK